MARDTNGAHDVACPLCGHASVHLADGLVAPWIGELAGATSATPTQLRRCPSCDADFFSHRFSEQELDAIYGGYRGAAYLRSRRRWEPWYRQQVNDAGHAGSAHVTERRQFMLRFLLNRGPFRCAVDFGGDEGQFFPDAATGRRVVVDPSTKPLPPGVERVPDIEDLASDPPDLVICAHVLEHLNDPGAALRTMRRVMHEDGLLYVEVPLDRPVLRSPVSPPGSLQPRVWFVLRDLGTGLSRQYRGNLVPRWGVVKQSEHINYFSERSLRLAVEAAGFTPLSCVAEPDATVAGLRLGRMGMLARPDVSGSS